MKKIYFTLIALCLSIAAMAAGRDTYTVIVSLDGFRWDYPEAFDVPFLNKVMPEQGVKAIMMPSFPSKTFPNHYTLATGLYPDNHGIIANKFKIKKDNLEFSLSNTEVRTRGEYYGGDPIWLTAKRQGVKSATLFWVGSDVAIKNDHPNYWKDYLKDTLSFEQRADEVIRLLSLPEQDRPHLVMCYFEEPDASGHTYGPITMETRKALEHLDTLLSDLWTRLQAFPFGSKINFIVTGDHGMTWCESDRSLRIYDYLPKHWVDKALNDFPVLFYASTPEYVDSIYNTLSKVDHLRVWRKGEVPAYLNYGNNVNMGDIIVLPDVGWVLDKEPWVRGGTHGYDNTMSDMLVAFRAVGPDFKKGYVKPDKFQNVCVYPLLAHLLGITPSPNDGDINKVADLLK